EASQATETELTLLIDHLMGIGGELVEPLDDVRRIGSRSSERELLAGATIQAGQSLGRHRLGPALVALPPVEEPLPLFPVCLVACLELQRCHTPLPLRARFNVGRAATARRRARAV